MDQHDISQMVQEIVRKEIQEYCAANLPAMIRTELEKITHEN